MTDESTELPLNVLSVHLARLKIYNTAAADAGPHRDVLWKNRLTGLSRPYFEYLELNGHPPQLNLGCLNDWIDLAEETKPRIRRLRDRYSGATIFCIGNGPSINQTDLSLLNDQIAIGTNRAYELLDRFQPKCFHLVVQDSLRLRELSPHISTFDYPIHIGNCFFSNEWAPLPWIKNQSVYMPFIEWKMEAEGLTPYSDWRVGFSACPTTCIAYGYSVIFSAIQFANYFGAARIVCIGIDMDFSKGAGFSAASNVVMPWFDYDEHCKPMFIYVHRWLESRGIELINATPGGKVDDVKRMDLRDVVAK